MKTETIFNEIMTSDVFRNDGKAIDLCAKLNELCAAIKEEEETDWSIGECLECSLDSLLIGAYWSLTECHGGQSSNTYETMCIIGTIFKPGMAAGPEEGSEQTAYDLVTEYLLN